MRMGMVRKDTRTHYMGTLYCTKEAFDANRAELRDITDKQIPETTREKSIAREKGDLRENSEYDAAKLKLAQLYARQREIAERIKNVVVVREEAIHTDVAGFGTHVTLRSSDGTESNITLAGEWDDMPEENIISIASPLGQQILGKNGRPRLVRRSGSHRRSDYESGRSVRSLPRASSVESRAGNGTDRRLSIPSNIKPAGSH